MSNAPKYRKRAVEFEGLKQFDRAVASYVRAIEENENASEEVDVALFNKVGDLTLRQGRVTEAVTYYERAVEHYVTAGLFDNAIALCNKILRNAPGRSNVYYTLGRICARKGLRSDATRNFLEYATRMQQDGRVDEGMRALAEIADLMPELTEVGRLVEEHAARAGIALAPRRRLTPTRTAAQPDVDEVVHSFSRSKHLVFLDIDYDGPQPSRGAAAAPTVVDGASILTPFVDVETPLPPLAGLEPTELTESASPLSESPRPDAPTDVEPVAATTAADAANAALLPVDGARDADVTDIELAPAFELLPDLDMELPPLVQAPLPDPEFTLLASAEEFELVDAFQSEDEFPPLIFPMESGTAFGVPAASRADVEGAPVDASAGDVPDDAARELPDDAARGVAPDASFDEIVPGPADAARGVANDASFEGIVPAPADTARDVVHDAEASAESGDLDVAGSLDDLFLDADVPTAVAAAEATLVASSRRDELRSAVAADATNWALRRRLAEALFEAGERDAALSELGTALLGFERAGALALAADIADELVRVAGDEVVHHQKRLELTIRLADQTRLRDAYLDLADTLVRRGEDLRAKAVYARVLEIDPWDDRARTALGDAAPPAPARPAAEPDSGHVDLAAWLRDDDEPASTRMRMREPDASGDEQQDFDSLLRHFKDGVARSLGEDDYDSRYDLGVAYKEMGLLDDAIGEFQKALRSRTNRLAAYEALGQCFLEKQNYKVAVTVLSRALHEPAFREEQRVGVLYLLGYSCEALQRFDEARSYFQRVYATDIHFRDVARRLTDLDLIAR